MIYLLAVIVGLIVGSFLNVVIVRYPKMLEQRWKKDCMDYFKQPPTRKPAKFNLITPRSHCPKCRKKLKWWHNIPILSYLVLCGRCAFCQKPIAQLYPIVELFSAIITIVVIAHFGITWQSVWALIFSWGLIVLGFIDFRKQVLPDELTLSLLWIGLLANGFFFYTTPRNAIFGAIAGYIFLWTIAKLFTSIRKKNGMGHGDFKMFAMLGAWLGISMLLNILLIAVLIALLVSFILILTKKITKKKPIPFGPYLALGGWLSLMFGPVVAEWITRMTT